MRSLSVSLCILTAHTCFSAVRAQQSEELRANTRKVRLSAAEQRHHGRAPPRTPLPLVRCLCLCMSPRPIHRILALSLLPAASNHVQRDFCGSTAAHAARTSAVVQGERRGTRRHFVVRASRIIERIPAGECRHGPGHAAWRLGQPHPRCCARTIIGPAPGGQGRRRLRPVRGTSMRCAVVVVSRVVVCCAALWHADYKLLDPPSPLCRPPSPSLSSLYCRRGRS